MTYRIFGTCWNCHKTTESFSSRVMRLNAMCEHCGCAIVLDKSDEVA